MSTRIRTALLALALAASTGVGACGGGGGGTGGGGGGGGPSNDASLFSLTVSAGTLSPAFAPTVTDYTVVPAVLDAFVSVRPTVQATGATVSVNGFPVASGAASVQVPLGLSTTPVTVIVTAPDGTTTRTTTVVFTRKRSALSGLAASAGTLAPVFGPAQLSYSVIVALTTTSTTVTPTAADPAATIKVNTVTTASGTPSAALALPPGLTPVAIEVTAGDGITTTTYTVVFNRTLTGQQAYLKASNTELGDAFGRSVAVSGETLVVGAPFEYSSATGVDGDQADNGARDSGAAYVFVRNGATWSQQAYLKASNTGISDKFGWSVAISGETLVVGALHEGGGAAYVFVRSGTTWSQQAYLKASNTGDGDTFGASVSISGDTLVVGADGEASNATGVDGSQTDNSAQASGAAYVFVRSGTVWSQQAYLKASNTAANDYFGFSVAISGETVVVGAHGEDSSATGVNGNQADNGANGSGAAYVFVRAGTTWSQQAYLKASNTGTSDDFGISVTISGETVVVGASTEDSGSGGVNGNQADNSEGDSGAVYVFVRSGTTWSQQAYLKPATVGYGDNFGLVVALSGDLLVVGAYQEDSNAVGLGGDQDDENEADSGAAYLFVRNGTTWSQEVYVKPSNTGFLDHFGYSVAISDGAVVVGAIDEDSSAAGVNGNHADNGAGGSGAAYVFR